MLFKILMKLDKTKNSTC